MKPINTDELKTSKKIKKIIDTQQHRIFHLERALEDLARATEIAQYSQQYHVVEQYRIEAEEMLQDKLEIPDMDTSIDPSKMTIITGTVDDKVQTALNDAINKKAAVAAGAQV